MKVIVCGQGEVRLTQRDYVGSGGEGSVYARGLTAYKVYTDPARMLPQAKIAELGAITHPNIIKPEQLLLDPKKNTPVGYTMRFIRDAIPLCAVFPRAFRERSGLSPPQMSGLVERLQQLVCHVHRAGILIVDLNEMNFLVDPSFTEVYAIDVDSYQTRSYPATAIMPSVRDPLVQGSDFTEASDWFSFACIAFQMFVGIHPYKGRHPRVCGLEERMRAKISVLDPEVTVPKVVYPLDIIPAGYRSWLFAVLQEGSRQAPPADPGAASAAAVVVRAIVGDPALDIQELFSFPTPLSVYVARGGAVLAVTAQAVILDGRAVRGPTPVAAVGFSPKSNRAVIAWREGGSLQLFDATSLRDIPVTLLADAIRSHDGRIYVKSGDRIVEVVLTDTASGVVASARVAANVLEHASQLYDGVVVQDLLGSVFVSVLPSAATAHQIRVPELDGYKIIDAKYEHRLLMVLGAKDGRYDRLVFVFDEGHQRYRARPVVTDVTLAGLNFVVLDNGVCVHLNEEEKLEVSTITSDQTKIVGAAVLGNDMRLVKHGGRVAFVRGEKVFSIQMRL